MPYETLRSHYHQADVLLHTSLSEGQSEVVTEAMSAGVIVCGTNVGLLFDLPDCCVSVRVKDHQALAQKVIDVLRKPDQLAALRHNAKTWASAHSISWTVGEIKKLYDQEFPEG